MSLSLATLLAIPLAVYLRDPTAPPRARAPRPQPLRAPRIFCALESDDAGPPLRRTAPTAAAPPQGADAGPPSRRAAPALPLRTPRSRRPRCRLEERLQGFDAEMFVRYSNPPAFQNTDLTIVEYPDPVLRNRPNDAIEAFDDELAKLCDEMWEIMYASNGVGLAAPQVGLRKRLFVYNTDPTAPPMLRKMAEVVVCNPKILEYSAATDIDIEGCLSSRSECCCGDIRRAKQIEVEYQDVRGRVKKKRLKGFEARVFQHEYDHVEGVLHIDRQSDGDRQRIEPYLDALVDLHGDGGVLAPAPEVVAALQPPPLCGVVGAPPPAAAAAPPPKAAPKKGAAAAKKPAGFGGGGSAKKKKPKKR